MNYIDIILIVPLLWALYKGFKKGLVIEIASLLALILGIYGGVHFSEALSLLLKNKFDWQTPYLPIISFAIIFIGVVIVVYTIGKIIERFVDMVALGTINKFFGAIFGLAKSAVILIIIILIFDGFDKKMNIIPKEQKSKSLLYEPMKSIGVQALPYLNFEKIPLTNDTTRTESETPKNTDTTKTY